MRFCILLNFIEFQWGGKFYFSRLTPDSCFSIFDPLSVGYEKQHLHNYIIPLLCRVTD